MKIITRALFVLMLNSGTVFSQSLEERRSYHDPLSRTTIFEIYTVLAGTNTIHGKLRRYAANGTLERELSYNNGKPHGILRDYDIYSGKLVYEATFDNDIMIDEAEYYKEGSGKVYHKVMNGKWTYWHKNGKIAMEASLYPGNFWDRGEKKLLDLDIFYLTSVKGPLTKIKELKFYFENGQIASENYFNPEGVSVRNTSYYENGDKKSQWVKLPNSETYEEILYYETGSRKAVSTEFILVPKENTGRYVHLETVNQGKQKRWDEKGELVSEGTYANGVQVGQWKKYYDENWNEVYLPEEASFYRLISYNQEGRSEGKVRDFYITGEPQAEFGLISENPDVYDGAVTIYFKNGQVQTKQIYDRGMLHGLVSVYSESGLKTQEDSIHLGEIKGRKLWREDGTISTVMVLKMTTYKQDQYSPEEKFNVQLTETYHPNGKLESRGTYMGVGPEKYGEWFYYDQNGKQTKREVYDIVGRLTNR